MGTDTIGGRKFVAFILCMAGWGIVLGLVSKGGLLTGELAQTFLFYLMLVQGIFFGGNLVEKFIMSKLGVKDAGPEKPAE